MLFIDAFLVFVPVFEQLESFEAFLTGVKLVLSVLSALNLQRPGRFIAEINADREGILLREQVAPISLWVLKLRIGNGVAAGVELLDISASKQLIDCIVLVMFLLIGVIMRRA